MGREELAQKNRMAWHGTYKDKLESSDPELAAIRDRLFYGQIVPGSTLDQKQQVLVILASLTAAQNLNNFARQLEVAMERGATALEIRETLYQCAPYVGFPRVEAALEIANEFFAKRDLRMPLAVQGTVTEESRFREGLKTQKNIFGASNIESMQEKAPGGQQAIVTDYLSAYCFGDFYTRQTLDLKMRELVTFSAIVSLGGCDPQARAHASANVSVGNTKQQLVDALAIMLPFIGFPRTLNGLAAVNGALPE